LAIELLNSKQLPWGAIYNLSEKELGIPHYPFEVQLKLGWIRAMKSPASVLVFFVPQNDGTLQSYVDFEVLTRSQRKTDTHCH
jgi:hypothetical protein